MLASELNELVHTVADELDKHAKEPVDRLELNTRLTEIIQDHNIVIEEDY